MTTSFKDFPLSKGMLTSLFRLDFTKPSAIQAQAIPMLLQGADMLGQAQTGTGKTAAFAIPVIEQLELPIRQVQALILCPTRELAQQVTVQVRQLMTHQPKLRVVAIVGGESVSKQQRMLQQRPQVVVGTPGRVIDMLQRGLLRLDKVAHVVLDEADEMLDMGFRKDIEKILSALPEARQSMLFSATISDDIKRLAQTYLDQPVHIKTAPDNASSKNVQQHYIQLDPAHRRQAINQLILTEGLDLAVIFCNTQRQVDKLTGLLKKDGLSTEGLHGGLTQARRNRVMTQFRKGQVQYLVATDVAARGIDVKNIDAVFNYDFPQTPESYVHRIGRTGRADQTGKAFTFIRASERRQIKQLENHTKSRLMPISL